MTETKPTVESGICRFCGESHARLVYELENGWCCQECYDEHELKEAPLCPSCHKPLDRFYMEDHFVVEWQTEDWQYETGHVVGCYFHCYYCYKPIDAPALAFIEYNAERGIRARLGNY